MLLSIVPYLNLSIQKHLQMRDTILNNPKEFLNGIIHSFGISDNGVDFQPIGREKAITKQGLWSKVKAFLFQEIDLNAPIKVELTPYQQKVEDEINEFLHQDITWEKVHDFLFQEIKFGKRKTEV